MRHYQLVWWVSRGEQSCAWQSIIHPAWLFLRATNRPSNLIATCLRTSIPTSFWSPRINLILQKRASWSLLITINNHPLVTAVGAISSAGPKDRSEWRVCCWFQLVPVRRTPHGPPAVALFPPPSLAVASLTHVVCLSPFCALESPPWCPPPSCLVTSQNRQVAWFL